ncbi:MAG: translational GTPase TypA [Gemmatimonadetes bacterium]|nr:translational GTPase TypA [Gemmatimonadota bacterium]
MIRNIAIIAHVDHGKTTLVDKMLRQAGVFRANQQLEERVMDSNPLEKERGITILAKNTSVRWHDTKINIVDTPGHSDFGGEVERILRMVNGVMLLVDAAEGPLPGTRFVLRKAMELGLAPIVVINKIDRTDARPMVVHDEVLGLFMDLEASHEQLDAPFLYASSRHGVASRDLEFFREAIDGARRPGGKLEVQAASVAWPGDLNPLFQAIVDHVPPPPSDADGPFQMLISTMEYSSFLGRMAIGRIERGRVRIGQQVALLPLGDVGMVSEEKIEHSKVQKLFGFEGLTRAELEEAQAGDIIALAGLEGTEIGKTVTAPDHPERLRGIAVEEPTISVDFSVNNSPLSGREGKYVTSRQVRDRLYKELERNVALKVEDTDLPEVMTVSGRGELHLAILMETMRREGFEFQVSRPRVILKEDENGERLEPYEELLIDVPEAMLGVVMEKLGPRRSELIDMKNAGHGMTRASFRIPARGLFGYRSDFMTDTRGEGVMHHRFMEYGPWAGPLAGRKRGVMVADRQGVAVAFALFSLQERAAMFLNPGDPVYEGMIVGEHVRSGDLDVNITREKKLTNMRTTASDEMIRLETPREMTLEGALEYIEEDELIEVTPGAIRLRKRALGATDRRKAARQARGAEES